MAVHHHHHRDSAAVANLLLYFQFVTDQLTSLAPLQASAPDAVTGQLPLHMALHNNNTVRALILAHPEALYVADCVPGLPPFLLAAASNNHHDVVATTTCYELLLAAPEMLKNRIPRHSDDDVSTTGKTNDNENDIFGLFVLLE